MENREAASKSSDPPRRPSPLPTLGALCGMASLVITLVSYGAGSLRAQPGLTTGGDRPGGDSVRPSPLLLPFQGRLTTAAGAPLLEGEATVVFSLYDVPAGGAAAWTSGPLKLKVGPGGLVHATLGEADPLDKVDFSREVYLGVKVDNTANAVLATDEPEMLPRIRILPALHARSSDALEGHRWSAVEDLIARKSHYHDSIDVCPGMEGKVDVFLADQHRPRRIRLALNLKQA